MSFPYQLANMFKYSMNDVLLCSYIPNTHRFCMFVFFLSVFVAQPACHVSSYGHFVMIVKQAAVMPSLPVQSKTSFHFISHFFTVILQLQLQLLLLPLTLPASNTLLHTPPPASTNTCLLVSYTQTNPTFG